MHRSREGEARRQTQSLATKTSIGVILCRVNAKSHRPEVLLVRKRYTYAFSAFVHGKYARAQRNSGRGGGGGGGTNGSGISSELLALLENMTMEELLDVMSLNFEQMWYRIWLSRDKRDLYHRKHAKFQSAFMRDDGGSALCSAVKRAQDRGVLLWEVPKGRRSTSREPDLSCAVRELQEETGIAKGEYRLLPGVRRAVRYVSDGVRYVCEYFVAIAGPHLARREVLGGGRAGPGRSALREINSMGEVGQIRWLDIEQIRLLDSPEGRLELLVAPAFRLVKLYLKGHWAGRRVGAHSRRSPAASPRQALRQPMQRLSLSLPRPALAQRQALPRPAPPLRTSSAGVSPPASDEDEQGRRAAAATAIAPAHSLPSEATRGWKVAGRRRGRNERAGNEREHNSGGGVSGSGSGKK